MSKQEGAEGKKPKTPILLTIIPKDEIQALQDRFAATVGVASSIVDVATHRRILPESNPTAFCSYWVRNAEKRRGEKLCDVCDKCHLLWIEGADQQACPRNSGQQCAKHHTVSDEIEFWTYTCHAGLREFAAPILLGRRHVATIWGGQVLTDDPTEAQENDVRRLARKLKRPHEGMISAFRDVHRVSEGQLKNAAGLLALFANSLSRRAYDSLKLTAIQNVNCAVSTSKNLEELCKTAFREAGEVLGFDFGSICLARHDCDGDHLAPIAYLGTEELFSKTRFERDSDTGLIPFIARQKVAKSYDNLRDLSPVPPQTEIRKERDASSWLGLPLMHKHRLLGVFEVAHRKPAMFDSNSDGEFLKALSLPLTMLYQRESLVDFLNDAMGEDDLSDLLLLIKEQVEPIFGVPWCSVFLFPKDDTKRVVLRETSELSGDLVGTGEYALDEGLTGWVAKHGEPIILPCGWGEEDLDDYHPKPSSATKYAEKHVAALRDDAGKIGAFSLLASPIEDRNGRYGVIRLSGPRVETAEGAVAADFNRHEVAILQLVARTIARVAARSCSVECLPIEEVSK